MSDIINQIADAIEAEIHEAWTESDADFNRGMEYAVSIVRALDIRTDSDTISRQDAIDAFGLSEKTRKYGGDHSGYNTMMLYEIQDVLESLPSEPDSRQCGEWVWKKDAMDWGIGAWVCNKCGCRPNTLWSTKRDSIPLAYAGSRFCGYCGAYMGGQNDD